MEVEVVGQNAVVIFCMEKEKIRVSDKEKKEKIKNKKPIDKENKIEYSNKSCENDWQESRYPPHPGTSKWPGFIQNWFHNHAAACRTDAVNERIVYYLLFLFYFVDIKMSMEVHGY